MCLCLCLCTRKSNFAKQPTNHGAAKVLQRQVVEVLMTDDKADIVAAILSPLTSCFFRVLVAVWLLFFLSNRWMEVLSVELRVFIDFRTFRQQVI